MDDILGPLGEAGRKLQPDDTPVAFVPENLDETEQTLFDALADVPLCLDELVARTGIETGQAAGTAATALARLSHRFAERSRRHLFSQRIFCRSGIPGVFPSAENLLWKQRASEIPRNR